MEWPKSSHVHILLPPFTLSASGIFLALVLWHLRSSDLSLSQITLWLLFLFAFFFFLHFFLFPLLFEKLSKAFPFPSREGKKANQKLLREIPALHSSFSSSSSKSPHHSQRTPSCTSSLAPSQLLQQNFHHQVKNLLQVILSLFYLHSHYLEENPKEAFRKIQQRIHTIAQIYEKLTEFSSSRISASLLLPRLFEEFVRMHPFPSPPCLLCHVEPVLLPERHYLYLGILLHEWVSNSLTHAFPPSLPKKAVLELQLKKQNGLYQLSYRDNGIGISAEELAEKQKLGYLLIQNMACQLKGTLKTEGGLNQGLAYLLSCPLENSSQ